MTISIIYFLLPLLDISNSQWQPHCQRLCYNWQFTTITGLYAPISSGGFLLPSIDTIDTTANFITCTNPSTSYITLNNIYPTARDYYESTYQDGDWISIDLYFQSIINQISIIHTWSSQNFQFTIGSFQYTYAYNSPTTYPLITGFCDDTPFQIKTLNFTLSLIPSEIQSSIILTSSNTNQGTVSIRNIYVSRIQCYSICTECTGPQYNQCTKCYYGLPTNNICPSCPSNQYYMKEDGCRNICDLRSPLYYDGFCQYYLVLYIDYGYLASEFTNPINLRWQLIYDPQHIDTTPTIINHIPSIFGIFKFNSGIYRYFTNVPDYQYSTYFIGLKISIVLFNDIPINCGIQFKIMGIINYNYQQIMVFSYQQNNNKTYVPNNNIYYGSIYRNTSGIQTAKFTIFKTQAYDLYLTYSSVTSYELISYLDIPKQAFLVSAIGNYTDGTAGWGMAFIQISSGYCPLYCQLCEVEQERYLFIYTIYMQDLCFWILFLQRWYNQMMVEFNIPAQAIAHLHIRDQTALIAMIMMMKHLILNI